MPAHIPERIGKYPISAVLGHGAMGVVYKGFDPHIHRPVAIKTIHKDLLGDEAVHASIAARFRNEAQAVGRLQHPGIVAIYEFGEDDATAYIAMEFVEGKNLDQVLAATPVLPEAQVRRIMDQLLDALECAHRAGVWHRDIKPANLILTAAGQVKLTDFGIARIENIGLTQVASMIGTPGYMAPEQYIGEGIDHRADLFAAGVLLYRLLTGVQPFSGAAETVMYKIMNEQPKPPSEVSGGGLSGVYDALMLKALAKGAENRFQSAQAFRQALLASATHPQAAYPGGANDATVIVPQSHWVRAVEAAAPPG
jgi:serine/threonine protein kinase